jgi:DNA (cytosine-5)-methyltransferase 1
MSAYYNEIDPNAAQWLRNLIAANLIAPGDVDERSIAEVQPDDVRNYTQVHFFAGIGGWGAALRIAGWPDDRPVWTGSCPCQPFSCAGKRKGDSDPRNLWPDMFRLIRECRPDTIFGEQVASAIGHGWLDRVCADLEAEGYAVGTVVLGAHSVGAPHIRQRLFWVADAGSRARERNAGAVPATEARIGGARGVDGNLSNRFANGGGPQSGSLADSPATRCGWRQDTGASGVDARTNGSGRLEFERSGEIGRLGNANRERCAGRQESNIESLESAERAPRGADIGGSIPDGVALGDTISTRSQGYAGHGDNGHQSGRLGTLAIGSTAAASAWDSYAVIRCADGKFRRVPQANAQSEILGMADGIPGGMGQPCPDRFPLAQKTPARAIRLKGYGNAIVPQLAAEFILAADSI